MNLYKVQLAYNTANVGIVGGSNDPTEHYVVAENIRSIINFYHEDTHEILAITRMHYLAVDCSGDTHTLAFKK